MPLWAASAADLKIQPGECLVYFEKCYTYYGLTPSFIRLPAILFVDEISKLGSTTFIMIEYAIFLIACFLLTDLILNKYMNLTIDQAKQVKILVSSTIIVSPQIVLSNRGYFYEEAILSAITFLLLSVYFVLLYSLTDKNIYKFLVYLTLFLTLHSRFTEGIAAIIIYLGFVLSKKDHVRKKFLELIKVTLIFASLILLNLVKFKTLFPSFTTHHAGTYLNLERKEFYEKYGQFNPLRSLEMLITWLWPNGRNWPSGLTYYPGNYELNLNYLKLTNITTEHTEGFVSLPIYFPLCIFVSLIGLTYLLRLKISIINIVALGLFVNVLFVTGYISQTLRYAAEFTPIILILIIIGYTCIMKSEINKKIIYTVFAILLINQSYTAFLVTINFFESINSTDLPMEHISFFSNMNILISGLI